MPTRTPRSNEPALRMSVEPHAGDELRREVSDRLDLFNVATTGLDRWHAVSIFLRDPDDEIVGGLLGEIWGGWLEVKYLWVAEPFRGRGQATELLRAAERFALARGCHASHLDSYTFQAPDFYVKHGYHVFGVLDDYPPGHQRVYLRKTLAAKDDERARMAKPRGNVRRRVRS